MKLFEKSAEEGWGNRLNLIDKNNVFVGYDYEYKCHEEFGYEFRDEDNNKIDLPNLEDFVFTLNHKKIDVIERTEECPGEYGFEITDGKKNVWFVIYNYQNGYYNHGFEFVNDNETIVEEYL